VIFLDFFYRGILREEIPTNEWCKLLVISSKLNSKEVRARAIKMVTANISKVPPVDRIEIGNKYSVPQWLPGAYKELFIRKSQLTVEEGEKLGLEVAVKVLQGRDKYQRNRRYSNGANVTQLVEEIFPPASPQKKVDKFVY